MIFKISVFCSDDSYDDVPILEIEDKDKAVSFYKTLHAALTLAGAEPVVENGKLVVKHKVNAPTFYTFSANNIDIIHEDI